MNKSWIDTETEVEMSINMDKIKYLVQNPLLIKSKFPEFKSQFSTQTSTFSKFLNELTLIYTPPQNDLSIAKQTYRKVRSTKPKHFNKINHHIKPYSRIYDADRKDLVIPAEEVEKKRKSPEQAKITANDEADENVFCVPQI